MTQDSDFKIKSVAIIGSGVAGLTSLFELLHTKNDGSTSIHYDQSGELDISRLANDNPAFSKIVAFEQSSKVGGIWAPSFDKVDVIPQEIFDTEQYNDPYVLKPQTALPDEFKDFDYTFKTPFSTKEKVHSNNWANSGIYKLLYSNVPSRYLRNSFIPFEEKKDGKDSQKDLIYPLITNSEISERLRVFLERFELGKHIRLNSEVVDIRKTSDNTKWRVTVKQSSPHSNVVNWYSELFDAVIVGNGHYSVPHVPKIKGLSSWNSRFESSIFHSKAFRTPKIFENKVCLFVGTGLSGIDILQYAFPIAKSVIVSRTQGKKEIYDWLTNAATSDGIIVKPRIKELRPQEGRKVLFDDGSFVDSVDYIIFSTGYHWHYPFLSKDDTEVSVIPSDNKKIPDGSSMVEGLHLNTFAIKDPSLAFVGVTLTPFKWPSFELTASAIAGVWTNNSKLPEKAHQNNDSKKKLERTGQSVLYHYYPAEKFPEFVEELSGYLPKGRSSTNIYDGNHLNEIDASFLTAEKLFYQLKRGEINVSDTLLS